MATDDEDLAALGPFFAVQRTAGPVAGPDCGPWRRVRDLLDPGTLDERVAAVRTVLSRLAGTDVEQRVAASTMSLGLFARLLAPVLGAAVLGLRLPRPSFDQAWWQPVAGGPWPLAFTGPDEAPDPAAAFTDVVLPLAQALAAACSLSTRILRGNAASAVFGAVTMIGSARPDLATAARDTAGALLAGPLAGTGDLGESFVRSSCCLYYRIPGGGYCGDCVLAYR
jgi:hypothetical protein